MRHDLLGYLLGALDADERVAIEQQLKIDPQLREQLRVYQARLGLLGMSDQERDPPGGLAERTVNAVNPDDRAAPAAPVFRPDLVMDRAGEASSGWTFFDAVVVSMVMLLCVLLFFRQYSVAVHWHIATFVKTIFANCTRL